MTYTRYEIAINDKFNRFENRIELEELIAKAIRSYGLGIGADVEVVTMDVITVPVDVEAPNIRRPSFRIFQQMTLSEAQENLKRKGYTPEEIDIWTAGHHSGGNYIANDSTFPTEITFQNGRKVGIAFDGDKPYLTVGIVE